MAVALACASPVRAQNGPAQPAATPGAANSAAAQSSDGVAAGEIIVTANRYQSLASRTPVTLTAIRGDALQSAGITSASSLNEVVPNLNVDRGNGGGIQLTIRGVTSTDTTQKGDPSAAFLLDGIYIPFQNAQDVSLYDLDRVEVLRGPQGTLYGRNTTAGVINIISAQPTRDLGVRLDADFGNFEKRQVTGVLNIPLTETLAVRVAANYDYNGPYVYQAVPDQFRLPADRDNLSTRFSMLFKPTDRLTFDVKADYSSIKGAGSSFGTPVKLSNFFQTPLVNPPAGVREPDPVYLDPDSKTGRARTYADVQGFSSNDYTWGITGQVDWQFADHWTATLLTGYRAYHRDELGSQFWDDTVVNGVQGNDVRATYYRGDFHAISQEGRIAYTSDKLKFQTGGYYFHQSYDMEVAFANLRLPAQGSVDAYGIFAQGTYSITPKLRATVGARYSHDKKDQTSAAGLIAPPIVFGTNVTEVKNKKVTWKAGLDYDLGSSTLLYGTISTGYKAGGFNSACNTPDPGCAYAPETLTDYEIGVKTRIGGLRLTADAFHYDYRNLQISTLTPIVSNGVVQPSIQTRNAAGSKVDGVETEGSYVLGSRNRFDFSVAWLHARYTDFPVLASLATSGTYNGAALDRSPKWQFSGGYTYTLPLAAGANVQFNVHSRYSSRYALLNTNINAQFWQPQYTKTDASVRYNAPSDHWYIEGYVKNIEDNLTIVYINTTPDYPTLLNGTLNFAQPRTYGVRLGCKF